MILLPAGMGLGAAPFDPRAYVGQGFTLDDQSVAKPNADGSGSDVTTNGASVRYWTDRGPNGLHLSMSGGTAPTLSVTSGERAITFASGASNHLSRSWAPGTIAGDYTYAASFRRLDNGLVTVLNFLAGAGVNFFGTPWSVGGQRVPGTSGGFPVGVEWESEWFAPSNYSTRLMMARRSGTLYCYINGNLVGTRADATSFTPDSIRLALNNTTGSNVAIEAVFFNPAVGYGDSFARDHDAYYRGRFPVRNGRSTNLLIWQGNSLGTGFYSGVSSGIMPKVQALAPGFSHWLNASVGAKTGATMLGDTATRIVPLFDTTTGRIVVIVWELTNDMSIGGKTAAQAAANVFGISQVIRAANANARVVIPTCIDRNDSSAANAGWSASSSTPGTKKADANALVLNAGNQSTYGYLACDLTGISAVSGDLASNNATNFLGDHVHLTSAGNDLIKQALRDSANAALIGA